MIKIKKINKINDISTGRFIFFVCSIVIVVKKGSAISLINDTTKIIHTILRSTWYSNARKLKNV